MNAPRRPAPTWDQHIETIVHERTRLYPNADRGMVRNVETHRFIEDLLKMGTGGACYRLRLRAEQAEQRDATPEPDQ